MKRILLMIGMAVVVVAGPARADWRWGNNTAAPLNGDYNTTANWNNNANSPNIPTLSNGNVYIGIGDYQPGNAGGNILTINGTAQAQGINIGYNSPSNTLILASGSFACNGQFNVGTGGGVYQQTGGNSTFSGGGLFVGNGGSGSATSQLLLDAGTVKTSGNGLSIGYQNNGYLRTQSGTTLDTSTAGTQSGGGGELRIGDSTAGATWDFQNGATVYVGGELYNGVNGNGTVNQAAGTTLTVNGSLHAGYGGSGPSVWTQAGGTTTVNNEFRVGENGGATGTYNLNGGTLTVNVNGGTGYIGVGGGSTGVFNQAGGTVYVGRHGQEFNVGYSGSGTWNLGNASVAGNVLETGTGSVNLRVRNQGTAEGTIQGWGTWGMTGYTYMDGIVRANGYGTDRTLDFSSFAGSGNSSIRNNMNNNLGDAHGWYAVNHGKLLLPALAVSSGNTTLNWGEDQSDSTLDLINSMRLAFNTATAGSLSVSLLASDRTDVPGGLVNPVGVWDLAGSGGLSFSSVDLTFRYDDILAGANESNLKLFHYVGGTWVTVPGSLDTANNWLTATGVSSFSEFAIATGFQEIAVPEPSTILLLALGGALLRRRR